jgi:hypothetical protein
MAYICCYKIVKIMETYIMTFEDGMHYMATKITADDENAVCDGILSIIRCSDAMELLPTGEWQKLPTWGAE